MGKMIEFEVQAIQTSLLKVDEEVLAQIAGEDFQRDFYVLPTEEERVGWLVHVLGMGWNLPQIDGVANFKAEQATLVHDDPFFIAILRREDDKK